LLIEAHLPCPDCNSSDALSMFDDHTYCFSCEKHRWTTDQPNVTTRSKQVADLVLDGEVNALPKRKLSEETCKFFGYKLTSVNGKPCQVAPYHDKEGKLVAQKLRFPNKEFQTRGDFNNIGLFGEHKFKANGKRIVVVEGEIDAMSYYQASKWPVVSVPNGAQSAPKAVARSIDFLETFDEVCFMFDADDQGKKAAKVCAELITPGKAKIASLDLYKDANEYLKNNELKPLLFSVYNAKDCRPDSIINGKELWNEVNRPTVLGIPYPYPSFDRILFGLRPRELLTITAGSGCGKSTLVASIAYDLAITHNKTVGYVALEESVGRTGLRFMSMALRKQMHLPQDISQEDKQQAFDATLGTGRFILYDHFGSMDSDNLLNKLKYMVTYNKCDFIFIDHLSILLSGGDFMVNGGDERKQVDYTMSRLRSFCEETGAGIVLVSHLRRASGDKGYEDGLDPTLSSLRSSQSIAQLSDAVVSMSRNASEGENLVKVKCLKNRYSGLTGTIGYLSFDPITGLMTEAQGDGFEREDISI
jgi:twinkle protein